MHWLLQRQRDMLGEAAGHSGSQWKKYCHWLLCDSVMNALSMLARMLSLLLRDRPM